MNSVVKMIKTVCVGGIALVSTSFTVADTLYWCVDESGNRKLVHSATLKSAGKAKCTVDSVSREVPPQPAGSTRPRPSASASPTDFPKVSNSEQKARDSDRRAILDKELANELQNAEKARKALVDAGSQPADKLQPLRDTVALHERNVESLKKELGNLR